MAEQLAHARQRRRRLIRAPLAGPALTMMAGVLVARYLPAAAWVWLGAAGLGVAMLLASLWRKHLSSLGLAGAMLLAAGAGAFRTAECYYAVATDDIARCAPHGKMLATVRGRVASRPQLFHSDVEFGYRPEPQLVFDLQAGQVLTGEMWTPVSGVLRVAVNEPYNRYRAGDRVELVGWLGRFGRPANPAGFDAAAHARLRGQYAWMQVTAADGVTLLEPADRAGPLARLYWRVRASARMHFLQLDEAEAGHVATALVVGDRSPALRDLGRTMVRGGVAHFLSISGLHLAVFCGFIYLIGRAARLSPRAAAGVVLAALVAYLLVAEARAAILRSGIMAGAIALSVLLGRRSSALNALAAAAIVLLLINPLQLLQAGFQLSFAIVAGLLLLTRPMHERLFGWWYRRRGLMVFRGEERWRRWVFYRLADAATGLVAASAVAYLTAAPLVAAWFGIFSPWAVLLSILLFPLVVAVLIPGFVSMALAWPLPGLAATIGSAATAAAGALAWGVGQLEALPLLSVSLREVPVGWVILCYAALLAAVFAPRLPKGRWVAAGLVLALAGTTAWTQRTASPPDRAELHMLAVGAGQCAMLRLPDGLPVLIDAGTRSGFEVYDRVLEPFLRHQRYQAPSVAFISHPNVDHYSAMPGLARSGRLQRVYTCEDLLRSGDKPFSATLRLLGMLDRHGVEVQAVAAGDVVRLSPTTTAEVLWPPAGRGDLHGNAASLVLRIVHAGRSVLLPGDIGEDGMAELLATSRERLSADAVMLPHHGSWEQSLPAFLKAVDPQVVLCSNYVDPRGPPSAGADIQQFYDELRRRYRYFSTARHGWVGLTFGGGRMDAQTFGRRRQ
ncbi:MAG: ComEC/Rec2 family competence protein [Phycisphaerae bacterium]|nr:ComEC/Rec2 family competence protein [Phycisphaerae bacterium]